MDKQLNFETSGNPAKSGVYVVDRGEKLGKAFRYFNMESGKWSMACYEPTEAFAMRGTESALPFLPFHPNAVKVDEKTKPEVQKMQAAAVGGPSAKALAIVKAADAKILKAVTKPKATKSAKAKHPDGTVFFREDRQKWVVVVDGKQPAARPTKEGVLKWLAKAHPSIQPTIVE